MSYILNLQFNYLKQVECISLLTDHLRYLYILLFSYFFNLRIPEYLVKFEIYWSINENKKVKGL